MKPWDNIVRRAFLNDREKSSAVMDVLERLKSLSQQGEKYAW